MPVSRQRVEQLLGVDEHEKLDHKQKVDLAERREVVELTKDIAAMMARGGDILIGTDDDGEIAGSMDEALARRFDEADLRNKLERFIEGPFPLRVGVHSFDAGWVVAIHVPPCGDGIAVLRSEGSYEVEVGGKRKPKVIFRPGDVFVRHGSKSERWNQGDVRDFIDRIRERERAAWHEANADVAEVARIHREDRANDREPQIEIRRDGQSQTGTQHEDNRLVIRNIGKANVEVVDAKLEWGMRADDRRHVQAIAVPPGVLREGEDKTISARIPFAEVRAAAAKAGLPEPAHIGEGDHEGRIFITVRSLPHGIESTQEIAFKRVKPRAPDATTRIADVRQDIITSCYAAYMDNPQAWIMWRKPDVPDDRMNDLHRESEWLAAQGYLHVSNSVDGDCVQARLTHQGRDFAEGMGWTGAETDLAIERDAEEQDRRHLLACRDARSDLFHALREGYQADLTLGARRLQWLLEDAVTTDPTSIPACIGALADLLRHLRLPDVELHRVRATATELLRLRSDEDARRIVREEIRDRGGFGFGGALLLEDDWYSAEVGEATNTAFVEAVEANAGQGWTLLHDHQLRVVLRVWQRLSPSRASEFALAQANAQDPTQRLKFLDSFVLPVGQGADRRMAFDLPGIELVLPREVVASCLATLANGPLGAQARHVLQAFRQATADPQAQATHPEGID
jgi:hypothetical protein